MSEPTEEHIFAALRARPVLFAQETLEGEGQEFELVLTEKAEPTQQRGVEADNDCACS
jgi:hypothetical protein